LEKVRPGWRNRALGKPPGKGRAGKKARRNTCDGKERCELQYGEGGKGEKRLSAGKGGRK